MEKQIKKLTLSAMFVAIAMTFELATYGAVSGIIYNRSKWRSVFVLYRSIIVAMLAGRIVWGLAEVVLIGLAGNTFTWSAFMAGTFFNAIPGIIVQLTLIPVLMVALHKTGLVKFKRPLAQKAAANGCFFSPNGREDISQDGTNPRKYRFSKVIRWNPYSIDRRKAGCVSSI